MLVCCLFALLVVSFKQCLCVSQVWLGRSSRGELHVRLTGILEIVRCLVFVQATSALELNHTPVAGTSLS